MHVIDLPLATAELVPRDTLAIRHELLELDRGLDPGQLLFGQDENGAYWGIEVLDVTFDETSTRYRLAVGAPVDPAAVSLLSRGRLSCGRYGPGDVQAALTALGTLSQLTA